MNKETKIAIDRRLLAVLLLQSFRYCLGRMTYAVSECVEHLTKYWDCLPVTWQAQIHNDIRNAIERKQAGMDMDVREWEKILELEIGSEKDV